MTADDDIDGDNKDLVPDDKHKDVSNDFYHADRFRGYKWEFMAVFIQAVKF